MNYVEPSEIKRIVACALREDVGRGDITNRYFLDKDLRIAAVIVAQEKGILCGIRVAQAVFQGLDRQVRFRARLQDGCRIARGTVVAAIAGNARSILSAERVGLNFVSLLSGIATRTRSFVEGVRPYKVKILDTRKTLPGLRALEKYAVRVGGGYNHRMSLAAMALIKENHLDAAGSEHLDRIVARIRHQTRGSTAIEIEARTVAEFMHALRAKPDIILLDNMPVHDIRTAVGLRDTFCRAHGVKRVLLEASGNIRRQTLARYAATGIERISLGTLTKDVKALDFSLDIRREK